MNFIEYLYSLLLDFLVGVFFVSVMSFTIFILGITFYISYFLLFVLSKLS